MKWTEKDIILLKRLYPDKNVSKREIINSLKRSWDTIRHKAYNIGLTLRTPINYWTAEDVEKLRELSNDSYLTSNDISKVVNHSPGSVRAKLSDMLIVRPKKEKKIKSFNFDKIEEHIYE